MNQDLTPRRLVVVAVTLALAAHLGAQSPSFDLIIRGGRVVDGSGNPWFTADVGIRGDSIAAVAAQLPTSGARVIDATGLVVAPGFIDVHSHSEPSDTDPGIIGVPLAENNVRQGVTTVFVNPDGGSPIPLRPFLEKVAEARPAINVGSFVGHGAVRKQIVGTANRPATPDEMEQMRSLVREAMEDGAFGLSTGLFYVPGNYAPLDEVIDLAAIVGRHGGIHESHIRNEAAGVLDSVRETVAIGERGRLPTQVTHHKIIGKTHWGKSVETLRLVDEARARGVDVTIDQYPYTASSTSIEGALVPQWAQAGGREAMLKRLQDPQVGQKVRAEIRNAIENERGGGDPANIALASCPWDPTLNGKHLAQVLRERGSAPTVANAVDLVTEIIGRGGCAGIFHAISEEDLVRILKHPATMVASDAYPGVPEFGKDVPHPRAYGTFARVLGVYVREKGVISLEEAVRKMTSFPAARMGLFDRGLVRPGTKADVVVFDPAGVKDQATFERPHQYAVGVSTVVVNGQLVLDQGSITGARPGRVLSGPGYRP